MHRFFLYRFANALARGRRKSWGRPAAWMFCGLGLLAPASANWSPKGLGGGNVKSFYAQGNLVFVQGIQGYFRSTDRGESWVFRSDFGRMDFLAVAGNSVFTGGTGGVNPDGVWRSHDWMENWSKLNFVPNQDTVRGLFASGNSVIAVTGNELWLSKDDGATWTQSPVTGLASVQPAGGFRAAGHDLFLGSLNSVLRSSDSGATWALAGKLPDSVNGNVEALQGNDSVLLAASKGHFYRSTDRGAHWNPLNNVPTDIAATVVSRGSDFFAAARDTLCKSSDGGITWSRVGRAASLITQLIAVGDTLYAGTFYSGVFLSADGGKSWTRLKLPAARIQNLYDFDGKLFAGLFGEATLFRTADQGAHWDSSLSWEPDSLLPIPPAKGFSMARSGENLFAIVSSDGRMRRSNDGGQSWSAYAGGKFSSLYQSGSNLFARVDGVPANADTGFYRFDSAATSWTRVSSQKPREVLASMGSIFFTVEDSVIERSTDGGITWTPSSQNLGDVGTFAVCGTDIFAGARKGIDQIVKENVWPPRSSLFRSSDSGKTWDTVQQKLSNFNVLYAYGPVLFAAGAYWAEALLSNSFVEHEPAVMRSVDQGLTWTDVGEGFDQYHADTKKDVSTTSLVVSGSNLCAGTNGSGIWCRALSELAPGVTLSVRAKNLGEAWQKSNLKQLGAPFFDATGRRADRKNLEGHAVPKVIFIPQ